MNMKHIGRHGDRKVAIVYKTVPEQDHMALVLYTETMPAAMHDAMMRVIESKEGQNENELADVLFRNLFTDGRPMLETLHREGMIKKVEAKQIIVTPNAKSNVNLGELNDILKEMASGQEAAERLAKLDANAGLIDPSSRHTSTSVLNNNTLAKQHLAQARSMEVESKSLLTESKRLIKEAYKLDVSLKPKPKKSITKKKAGVKKTPSSKKTTAKTKAKVKAKSKTKA